MHSLPSNHRASLLQPSKRFRSHVARVQSNTRPPWPPSEDIPEQPKRPRWKQPDGLLKPRSRPAARPAAAKEAAVDMQLDWRSYRAKLVLMERTGLLAPGRSSPVPFAFSSTTWAHQLPAPETGCLLVARQEGMDFFDRTVVLLAAHDAAHGSVGFVLNKPSPMRMCEVQLSTANAALHDTFGQQPLQLGGPVHMDTISVLHAYSGITGSQKVLDGVYHGGLPAAIDLIKAGLAKPQDFKLLLGMTGWAPGQLDQEIAAGAWFVVAAGAGVVLPRPQPPKWGPPDAMWKQVLEMIGYRPINHQD